MAMLAVVATSSMALVRTSYAAWSRHHQDNEIRQSATALVRHFERQVRQAKAVQAISPPGSLSLLMSNGDTVIWEHDASTKEVRFGVGTATDLLATGIDNLTFVGFNTTFSYTTEVGLIHIIYLTLETTIPRPSGTSTEYWLGSGHLRSW